jgi:NTE family protein
LVLGGGGPVGFAFHAGVLAALGDAGWDARSADLVVGTSIGAVTAGLLRAGMAPADLCARVVRTPLSGPGAALLERAGGWPSFPDPSSTGSPRWGRPASPALLAELVRHPWRIRPGLVIAALANAGSVDTAPISGAFDRLIGDTWPERATWLCAVDLDTGRRATFGMAGGGVPLGRAVAASCAVPSYFTPVVVGGRRHVDGGVHSPANTDLVGALAAGPDRPAAVVVSLPMGIAGPAGRRGVDIPGRRLNSAGARVGLEPLVAAGVPTFVVEPTASELRIMRYDAFDMAHLGDVAAQARATVAARLGAPAPADAVARAVLAAS